MTQHDILVRGSGAVGMAAALALSRRGWRVAMAAGLDEPKAGDVRAYALNAASVALLGEVDVWDAIPPDARTPVYEIHVEGDADGASIDFSAWSQRVPELAFIVDAAELEGALRRAVAASPLVQAGVGEAPATLQVLAEGKHSATRERLGVEMPRHPYGHRAIAGRLLADQPHAGMARQWFRSPDVLALLPLDRPRRGHGYGYVWSLPEARADALMAMSDAEFTAELQLATGGAAGSLGLASPRAQWPLMRAQARTLHGPGWVLVGDAAHVCHPLAGQGLNLGLADAAELASVLASREHWRPLDDPRVLARYARARVGPVRAMLQVTDGLLQLFASQQPLVRELRNRGLALTDRLTPLKRLLASRAIGG